MVHLESWSSHHTIRGVRGLFNRLEKNRGSVAAIVASSSQGGPRSSSRAATLARSAGNDSWMMRQTLGCSTTA